MHYRWLGCVAVLLLALSLLAGLHSTQRAAQAQGEELRCFAETDLCIGGPIRDYWENNGGLPVFGFPITEQRVETVEDRTITVQWFQRDRLEIQSDGTITAGRLGARLLELQGRPWESFPTVDSAPDGCRFFPETNHSLCEPFLSYWEINGGLERFGFPITEPQQETIEGLSLTVQYFERRRMEQHAQQPGNPVLLGLLGSVVLSFDQNTEPTDTPGPTPTPTPETVEVTVTPTPSPTPEASGPVPPDDVAAEIDTNDTDRAECETDDSINFPTVRVPGSGVKIVPAEFEICFYGPADSSWTVRIEHEDEGTNVRTQVFQSVIDLGSDGLGAIDWGMLPGDLYGDYVVSMFSANDLNTPEDTEFFRVEQADEPRILVLPRRNDRGDLFTIYLGGFDQARTQLYLYIRCSDDPDREDGDRDRACYRADIDSVRINNRGEGEIEIRFGTDLPSGTYYVVAADDEGEVPEDDPLAVSERFQLR
jgi:hypothetical protein